MLNSCFTRLLRGPPKLACGKLTGAGSGRSIGGRGVTVRLVLEVRTRNPAAMAVVRKGPPDHPRLGRSVSLRAQHARVWPTADLRAQPAQTMVVAQRSPHPRALQVLHRRPTARPIQTVELAAPRGLETANSAETKPKVSGVTSKPASWGHPKTSHPERDGRVIGSWVRWARGKTKKDKAAVDGRSYSSSSRSPAACLYPKG